MTYAVATRVLITTIAWAMALVVTADLLELLFVDEPLRLVLTGLAGFAFSATALGPLSEAFR